MSTSGRHCLCWWTITESPGRSRRRLHQLKVRQARRAVEPSLQQVGPRLPCGERDADDQPRERHLRVDRDAHCQLPDINNTVKNACEDAQRRQHPPRVEKFHSVAGFFACIQAYSATSRPKKPHALLPENSLKTSTSSTIPRPRSKNHSLYQWHLANPNDRFVPFISVPSKDVTFTIDGAQGTYEANIHGKKCKSTNFARHKDRPRRSQTP